MNEQDLMDLVTALRSPMVDQLADEGYARRRDRDLASAAAEGPGHRSSALGRRSFPPAPGRQRLRKPALITVGVAAVAGATAAALVLAVPGAAQRPSHGAPAAPGSPAGTAQAAAARQILLTAAANVISAPATGKYWRVREIDGLAFPGGTKAHPYDILLTTSFDQYNPSSAGEKYWLFSQNLGTVPATPADESAWRAAGSPTTWNSGQRGANFPSPWSRPLYATTAASAPSAAWTVSDGAVGCVECNLAGLKAAQFRQMPTSQQGVAAVLRHYYLATGCAKRPGCSAEAGFMWSEALALLQDPVSAQVRSATLKVMASLPGIRLLGPMTDPLGRHGYAFSVAGSLYGGFDNPRYHPVHAVVIDPRTGSLLATEDIGAMPRNVQCWVFSAVDRRLAQRRQAEKEQVAREGRRPGAGGAKGGRGPVVRVPVSNGKQITAACVGPSFEGRSYAGQVDEFTALVGAGWTNAAPVPPVSARHDLEFPGLPPGDGYFTDMGLHPAP
jgi:hypothetical protein